MKRVISILLTLALLIGCMSISVFANGLSEFSNDSMVNLLDYYEFEQIYTTPGTTETTFSIPLPLNRVFYGFDFIFNDISGVTAIYFIHPTLGRVPLNLITIQSSIKRGFGNVPAWVGNSVEFVFVHGSNPGWFLFSSFFVNYYEYDHFTAPVVASGFTPASSVDLSLNVGDSRPTQVTWAASDFNNLPFSFDVICPDWQKYDFLDFQFITTVKSITSISAVFGDINLPFSVSQVGSDSSGRMSIVITVRIDLTGIDRSSSSSPTLIISGNSNLDYLNAFKLSACSGYICTNDFNPFIYYFNSLKVYLNYLFSSLENTLHSLLNVDDSGSADQFQESVSSQAGELSGIADAMGSLDKPDPDSLNVNLDSFAVNANISGVGSVLAVPMRNDIILQVLIMTFTFALVGYALFGKR